MRELPDLFVALAKSTFRQRFRLGTREHGYLAEKGLKVVAAHARDLIQERLAPADPKNDGRQTPMHGHPIFIAQHATATCCRSCLAKWHGIPTGTLLSGEEIDHVIRVLLYWLEQQVSSAPAVPTSPANAQSRQQQLFD